MWQHSEYQLGNQIHIQKVRAMNRCIPCKDELISALLSNAQANFSKHMVYTLQTQDQNNIHYQEFVI
jgi:hypothetical protein